MLLPMVGWSLTPGNPFHWIGVVITFLFLMWTVYALSLLRGRAPDRVGTSVSAMLAGIILIDALAVSTADPLAAAVFLALLPPTLVFQRWIAPT